MRAHRALVTGCSSGIGAAVVDRLLAGDWEVIGVSRSTPPPRAGARWLFADLTDVAAVPPVLADVGHLDAVVHAAGVQRSARLGSLSAADGALMWRLHVDAAAAVVDAGIGRGRARRRIVVVGRRAAARPAGRSQ